MDGKRGAPQVIRIFESYGWQDAADVAGRLKDSLEESGYQVWIDREHLRPDDKHFSFALEDAVSNSEVVVALTQPALLARPDRRSAIQHLLQRTARRPPARTPDRAGQSSPIRRDSTISHRHVPHG